MVALSTLFAAVAALAALASLVFAWKTVNLGKEARNQYERDRRRERLERIAERVSEVRWAAHGPAHEWGQPVDHLEAVLAGTTEDLPKCQAVVNIEVPSAPYPHSQPDPIATDVEGRATAAQDEIKKELTILDSEGPIKRNKRMKWLPGR